MTIELTKPGVLLTPRDFSILENLYHYTVMSFSQIKEKHFSLIGKATAVNRLTKLQEASLISKKRLPRFIQTSTDLQISTVYQITKDGIRELQKRHVDKILRQEPVALNAFSIDHDLLLNEVMDKLHLSLTGSKIVNGKLLDKNASGISPDAVCTYQDNQIAIELELSLKSESRYRELILKYRMARDFEKVIYITQNQAIQTKLIEQIAHKQLPNFSRVYTDKFYFVDLSELLKSQAILQISNGKENLLTKEVSL